MSLDEPCGVLTVENRFAKVKVHFLSKQFSGDPYSKNTSIDDPAGSTTCKDHHALVGAEFLDVYYGNGYSTGIDQPAPTLPCKDRLSLITSQFFANEYSGGGQLSSIEKPSPSVTTVPKMKLVSVESSQFLFNPQYQSSGSDINKPCFTLIARMDKNPPYLISTDNVEPAIIIYEDDTPAMRKIKEFMAVYNIVDIKIRMLNIPELKRIMGFGDNYTLIGTQTEQKKFIGNAVEVNMSKALCEALCSNLALVAKCA